MSSRPSWLTITKRFIVVAPQNLLALGPFCSGVFVLINAQHLKPSGRLVLGTILIASSIWFHILLLRQRYGSFRYRHWLGVVEANVRVAMEIDDIGRFLPQDQAAIEDWCVANCKGHWRINHICVEFECDEDAVLFYMFHGTEPPKSGPRKPTIPLLD